MRDASGLVRDDETVESYKTVAETTTNLSKQTLLFSHAVEGLTSLTETQDPCCLVKDISALVTDASGLVRNASGLVRNASGLVRGMGLEKEWDKLLVRAEDLNNAVEDLERRAVYCEDHEDATHLVTDASGLVRNASGLVRDASGLVRKGSVL